MTPNAFRSFLPLMASAATLALLAGQAHAQATPSVSEVTVTAERAVQSYQPPQEINAGPLGEKALADTPTAITVVPSDLILNLQSKTVNDTLRYLPSVQVRDQQGYEVSRPQARGCAHRLLRRPLPLRSEPSHYRDVMPAPVEPSPPPSLSDRCARPDRCRAPKDRTPPPRDKDQRRAKPRV